MNYRYGPMVLMTTGLLAGCGGGSGGAAIADSATVPVISVTPTPTPTPSPTPAPAAADPTPPVADTSGDATAEGSKGAGTAFAGFDFKSGKAYPAVPAITIGTATYNKQSTVAYVPVSLSGPAPTTVIAPMITQNGTAAATRAISGTHYTPTSVVVIFRPGDPLTQTIAVPIRKFVEGAIFNVVTPTTPQGATRANSSATVSANSSVAPTAKATGTLRAPRVFAPTNAMTYQLTGANARWSDKGGAGVLSTSLVGGLRTQPANGETGLYLDPTLNPQAEAPFRIEGGDIVIHSQALASPITYGGAAWKYGAAMLNGRNSPETQLKYGQYEWTAKMSDRSGSWPALWLVATTGWPPEIDVYEGFGYKSDWNFNANLSSAIHGGASNTQTFMNYVEYDANKAYWLSGFASDFHKYAIDVEPDYITWFVDGVETYQAVNPFDGKTWLPLMNVAVKTSGAYDTGSGDMILRSMKVYAK